MSSSDKLKIDWCSYDAARYAVDHWHYSRSLPCSKTARLGVWEHGKFIGIIVFAWGANRHLAGEYKLKMTECAELCRIALDRHVTPVSRIISIAVKMLKREMPGIRLLVSYADLNQGHEGKPKYKYLLPLDDEMAERIESLSKPYPDAPQAKTTLRLDSIQEGAV